MADGYYQWPPGWKSRVGLGGAVVRLWLGSAVFLAGVGLAIMSLPGSFTAIDLPQVQQALQPAPAKPVVTGSIPVSSVVGKRAQARQARQEAALAGRPSSPAAVEPTWDQSPAILASGIQGIGSSDLIVTPTIEITDRIELARALQVELRRVGCYPGEIDGDWGPMSKRSMAAFMDRVNASLPVETPDPIMLRLVQGHATQVCGSICRERETHMADGRCIPTAVVARNPTRQPVVGDHRTPRESVSIAVLAPGEQSDAGQLAGEPFPGRMSVGAPLSSELRAGPSPSRDGARVPPQAADRPMQRAREASSSSYRPASRQSQRRWTQTIFEDIARR